MDVAFIGNTLYALVTIVSDPNTSWSSIGNNPDHNGIYRVDGPGNCTLVADIGAFAIAHPPDADIFLDAGVQYAMEPYRGGFLVTDGHHNRVLPRDARWRGQRVHHVRRRRSDRPRRSGEHDLHGRGRADSR